MRVTWTESDVDDIIIPILSHHRRDEKEKAIAAIAKALGLAKLSDAQLRGVFARFERGNYALYLGRGGTGPSVAKATPRKTPPAEEFDVPLDFEEEERRATDPAPPPAKSQDVQRLIDATRKNPVAFEELCDKLDMSPRRLRALIDKAKDVGATIDMAHDHVAVRKKEPDDRVVDTGVAPVVGETQWVGVISDLHFGSKYCHREWVKDSVSYMYERGAREVLIPGDIVDGNYKHGLFEVTHSGLEEQTRDFYENLPQLDGLTYHGITGNHDDVAADEAGFDPGDYYVGYFRDRGREDLFMYGRRGAFLRIRGAVVHLWHPRGANPYARSYELQKRIEGYDSGEKPHVLLAGHRHFFCYVQERGVHAIACPTFQGGGSAFGKSLKSGAPALGGVLLHWDITEHGTLRNFGLERRTYFERERPREVET